MIALQSQSVKVESRDDAQVEEKRQRLLLACGGFRAHDDHLKSFFNDPTPKAMGETDALHVDMKITMREHSITMYT